MRKLGVVLIGLVLVFAVGVAYNQCSQQGGGSCPAGVSPEQGNFCGSAGSCPASSDCTACATCADCDNDCADCELVKSDKIKMISGTVRYTRSTNKAVKVVDGDSAVLLRVDRNSCEHCQKGQMSTIAGLEKGDGVKAWYWTCAKSGKSYLTKLVAGGESTTDEGTSG